jgi:hypothetical protein
VNDEAIRIFNGIAEAVLMKCPRCATPFCDYDGCNALTCSKPDCGAAFCAVCLKDCGTDAHAHARQAHGNLFDKEAFEESRVRRERAIIDRAFSELSQESFELKQLVKNHVEKAGLGKVVQKTNQDHGSRVTAFIESSRRMLNQALRTVGRAVLFHYIQCCKRGIAFVESSQRRAIQAMQTVGTGVLSRSIQCCSTKSRRDRALNGLDEEDK